MDNEKKIELKDIETNGSFSSGVEPSNAEGHIGVWTAATSPQKKTYTWYENKC